MANYVWKCLGDIWLNPLHNSQAPIKEGRVALYKPTKVNILQTTFTVISIFHRKGPKWAFTKGEPWLLF